MGNSDISVGLVQLGIWEVERSGLEEPGTGWEEAVSSWFPNGNNRPPRAQADFPPNGWRVLHTVNKSPWASEVIILAAPSTAVAGGWVLVQLSRDDNGWQFATPWSYTPVPVRAERRQGLRLDWAETEYSLAKGSKPEITVFLINDSTRKWSPTEEDAAHVQGVVMDQQGNQIGSGWYAHGTSAQLPALEPGQRIELYAFHHNPEFAGLSSGDYQILAFLTALDLRTPSPARLTIY